MTVMRRDFAESMLPVIAELQSKISDRNDLKVSFRNMLPRWIERMTTLRMSSEVTELRGIADDLES